MEVRAVAKFVRVQPRKVRIVADEIKGKPAAQTAQILDFKSSKGARMLNKVLKSAIANAVENENADVAALRIKTVSVDEGPRMKRVTQKAMGRGARIVKKTAHITVVVEDYEPQGKIRPHGTKAKPRPTFAAPKRGKKAEAAPKAEEAVAPAEETAEIAAAEAAPETPAEAPAAEADDKKD